MTRIQQVVDSLFDRFPSGDLGGGPERDHFERLRSALAAAEEWPATLKRLYQADQCDDLALGLLWITDRLESDPSRFDAGPEEEEVFNRTLRRGLGLPEPAFDVFGSGTSTPSPIAEPEVFVQTAEVPSFDAPPFELPPEPVAGSGEAQSAPSFPSEAGADEGTSDPDVYGRLLEQFLEAVQSGSDERAPLLERLRANCGAVRADAAAPEEFKRYSELVEDFLSYINDHQLLDDVRVMNLVSNIQEPYGQWLSTNEADRTGILDQSLETLRDFRTMFE